MAGEITKEELERFFREKGTVTFAQLEEAFPEYFVESERLFTFSPLANYNIWIWTMIDDKLAKLIVELIQEKKLKVIPVHPIFYIMDGKWLNLPTANNFSKPYEEPHWLPVVLVYQERTRYFPKA